MEHRNITLDNLTMLLTNDSDSGMDEAGGDELISETPQLEEIHGMEGLKNLLRSRWCETGGFKSIEHEGESGLTTGHHIAIGGSIVVLLLLIGALVLYLCFRCRKKRAHDRMQKQMQQSMNQAFEDQMTQEFSLPSDDDDAKKQ